MEMSGQLQAPVALFPNRKPGTHWIGGLVGPRAGLDSGEEKKSLYYSCQELNPSRPVRSLVTILTELEERMILKWFSGQQYGCGLN